jgi:hypothetical protein
MENEANFKNKKIIPQATKYCTGKVKYTYIYI